MNNFWNGFEKKAAEESAKAESGLKEVNSKLDMLVQHAQSEQAEKQQEQHEGEKQQAFQEGQQSAADGQQAEGQQADGIVNKPEENQKQNSVMKGAPVSEKQVQ